MAAVHLKYKKSSLITVSSKKSGKQPDGTMEEYHTNLGFQRLFFIEYFPRIIPSLNISQGSFRLDAKKVAFASFSLHELRSGRKIRIELQAGHLKSIYLRDNNDSFFDKNGLAGCSMAVTFVTWPGGSIIMTSSFARSMTNTSSNDYKY